jgi:hypothetical protein
MKRSAVGGGWDFGLRPLLAMVIVSALPCGAGAHVRGTALPAATAPVSTAPAPAADGRIVLLVGGQRISARELNAALSYLPPPQQVGYAQHPELAAKWYGRLVALAQEARRERLTVPGSGPDANDVGMLDGLSALLIRKLAREYVPGNDAVKAYYRAHASEFRQVRAKHILLSTATSLNPRSTRTPAAAQALALRLRSKLERGAPFADLARRYSDDAGTRAGGGEMGWISRHQTTPSLDRVLFSLVQGRVSRPTKTRFGYEIVQVERRRTEPLEQCRALIAGRIQSSAIQRRLAKIVSAARIRLVLADGRLQPIIAN